MPTRCAAPATGSAARTAATPVTAIGIGGGTPAPAASTWAIPKLREATYFPEWLLERPRRAESALVSVVATSYLLGVSTRRMEKLVEQLGITRLSKSQVSEMAKDLDGQVEAFRTRPLDAGPYTFVAADALVLKVREGGRTVNVHALLTVGVNSERYREILGPARHLRGGRRRLARALP